MTMMPRRALRRMLALPDAESGLPLQPLVPIKSEKRKGAQMRELDFLPLELIKQHLYMEPDEDAQDQRLIQMSHSAVDYASNYLGRPVPWLNPDGTVAEVPASVVAALLMVVADLFGNREGAMVDARIYDNPAVSRFLHFYRVGLGA
ncbi:phage gp6-like head-tail connector protein [Alcaligenes faecalis]|nr:phage gp6-like head-tail connector protein [Alcaligenes faecalis]